MCRCTPYVCAVLLLFLLNVVELAMGAGLSVYALWLGPVEGAPLVIWVPMLTCGSLFVLTALLTWCVLQVSWCSPLLTLCAIFDGLGATASGSIGIMLLVRHQILMEWIAKLEEETGSESRDSSIPDIPALIRAHIGDEQWRDAMAVVCFTLAAVQLGRAFVACYLHSKLNERYYTARLQATGGDGGGCCSKCGGQGSDLDAPFRASRTRKFSEHEAEFGYDGSHYQAEESTAAATRYYGTSGAAPQYSPLCDPPVEGDQEDFRDWSERYMSASSLGKEGRSGMPSDWRGVPSGPTRRADGGGADESWLLGGTYKLEERAEPEKTCSVQ